MHRTHRPPALIRCALPAEQRADQQIAPESPRTAAEAAQRFFARYGAIIGGQDWRAAQRYLRTRAPAPATIAEWYAAAAAVRDQAGAEAASDQHAA